eukprot:TRINITY_DN5225_c0_g1_i2.p3 TRINITY_DN5225_c0_g1~~TRINITY_DN5225_c0_g1_i2.p3  ORF type:complete len:103 (+),score=34.84 TRINITY_DN5225_c0_g1_i2:25-333(+)
MIIDGRALGSSIYSTLLWRCSVIVTDLFFRMDVQFLFFFFFLMIRRPPRSTHCISSAASDVYKRQEESIYENEESKGKQTEDLEQKAKNCLLYTSPSPRDQA